MPARAVVEKINGSGFVGKNLKGFVSWFMERDSLTRLGRFEKYLVGKKILDVGVGVGSMGKLLKDRGYRVTGLDVTDLSFYSDYRPVIYDGVKMPLADRSQDTGLLICVLHHCSDPIKVLEETMRVCKRVIIIEDTYRNDFEKRLVSARDNLGNFEFYQHPYRTVNGWLSVFKKRGWTAIYKKAWSNIAYYGMYGRYALFVIEREK